MEGERERFERLFDAHYPAVRRYALRRVDEGGADDVAAEVFVVAWRRLAEVPADPLPWLYGVARRVCANQRRGAERQLSLAARVAGGAPSGDVAGPETVVDSALATAFAGLTDSEREVLALVAWEGLDARAAAQVVGCSAAAFTMRVLRARKHLRALLDEASADETDGA